MITQLPLGDLFELFLDDGLHFLGRETQFEVLVGILGVLAIGQLLLTICHTSGKIPLRPEGRRG